MAEGRKLKVDKILFMGFSVDTEYFRSSILDDPFPQVAAYKYEGRLLDGIREAGITVRQLASVAVSTFPRSKKIYFRSDFCQFADGDRKTLAVINLPLLKMISRFLGALLYSFRNAASNDAIVVFSAHSPYLLAARLNSLVFNKPYFVFILDLPAYMNFEKRSWLFHKLKSLDSMLISHLLRRARGLIVATKYMVEDFRDRATRPYLVVEGIADDQPDVAQYESIHPEIAGRDVVMYAGSVNAAHGIKELVEGFIQSSVQAELWICGRGDLEDYLAKVTTTSNRVRYLGFIPPEQVACIQRSCSLLVLARNPAELYTRYSFPSKLLEYLSSGVPVLTTDLPGIPEDLRPYLNVIGEFSIAGISKAFDDFFHADEVGHREKALQASKYVMNSKTPAKQAQKIVEFMRSHV